MYALIFIAACAEKRLGPSLVWTALILLLGSSRAELASVAPYAATAFCAGRALRWFWPSITEIAGKVWAKIPDMH